MRSPMWPDRKNRVPCSSGVIGPLVVRWYPLKYSKTLNSTDPLLSSVLVISTSRSQHCAEELDLAPPRSPPSPPLQSHLLQLELVHALIGPVPRLRQPRVSRDFRGDPYARR